MSEPTVTPVQPAPPAAPAAPAAPPAAPAPPPPAAPGSLVVPVTPPTSDVPPTPANDPAGVWAGDVQHAPGVTTVPPPTAVQPPAPIADQPYIDFNGQRFYTETYLETARAQERDKMHGRLSTIEQEMAQQRQEREAREQQIRDEAAQQAAEAERARLEGLPVEQRVEEMQRTWEQRWSERDERDRQREAFEAQEARLREVENFKARRVGEESDLIHPSLRDLVTGFTEEEVERSITDLKARTDAIVGTMREATVAQRQAMPGVAPTGAPPVGPMDQSSGYQSITSADIAAMDPATFAKNRPALMEALRRKVQTEGLYGA